MKVKVDYTNFDMYSKKICFFFNEKENISSLFGFLLYIYLSDIILLSNYFSNSKKQFKSI